MTYLSPPRIGFVGRDAMTNPSTANNEDEIHLLDYDNVTLVNPPKVVWPKDSPGGPPLAPMSDAAYRQWMTSMFTFSPAVGKGKMPEWRPAMPGAWNYWGDHLTTFGTASVNSVWLGDEPVLDAGADPLIGARVIYNARIVDLDPADTYTTQFVCAHFALLGRDSTGAEAELLSGILTTSFTRFLNFYRLKGAGTFQSVIANEGLTFIDDSRAPNSPAFRALRDGCRQADGLLLRHCLFAMEAANDMPALYSQFQQGAQPTNPKFGSVVGTVGVWHATDMPSTPVGRLLHKPGPPFFPRKTMPMANQTESLPRVKSHADVERVSPPLYADADHFRIGADAPVDAGSAHPITQILPGDPEYLGPAVAVVANDRVLLDLLTTFPEVEVPKGHPPPPDPFEKADYGDVSLVLYDGEGRVELGRVLYDRAAYERGAGVSVVRFPAEFASRVAAGSLRLEDAQQNTLLQEIECPEIEAEQLATYVDLAPAAEGGKPSATATLRLRAFVKGKPSDQPVQVRVQRWHDHRPPGEINSLNPLVVMGLGVTDKQVGQEPPVTIPADGTYDLAATFTEPGCFKLRFIPEGMPAPSDPEWAVEYFAAVRALPHDDYSAISDEKLTWDYVYEQVFSYYAILYPVMGGIIPWGPANIPSDPERVGQFASLMYEAVDARHLGTALQMPITRELSAGKRALVQRWCRLQLTTK
jgi:hypothetical protein